MRISDWSSDVCSSDLALFGGTVIRIHHRRGPRDTVLADFDDSRFIQLSSNNLKNISFGKLVAAHGRLRQIIPQIARHGGGRSESTRLNSSHSCANRMPSSAVKQTLKRTNIDNRCIVKN